MRLPVHLGLVDRKGGPRKKCRVRLTAGEGSSDVKAHGRFQAKAMELKAIGTPPSQRAVSPDATGRTERGRKPAAHEEKTVNRFDAALAGG